MVLTVSFASRQTSSINTAGWMNYANKPSQAVLEWASQDVYDVIASQCGAFDQMNIQKVLTGLLYN